MANSGPGKGDDVPAAGELASVSIGVFAHNEEATVSAVLRGFQEQRVTSAAIDRIIVVCCGCTDRTLSIVRRLAGRNIRIELIVRERREGKIAAINAFLQTATSDVLVLASGDVIPAPDLVERLVLPLITGSSYAMTGPRVMAWPASTSWRTVDELHNALWNLHHDVSLRSPKLGEIVAVRRAAIPDFLPGSVHCDEALLESLVVEKGGKLGYIPSALAYNFPPESLVAFYQQRRRIVAQHILLKRARGYRPSTAEPGFIADALKKALRVSRRMRSAVLLLCLLEAIARLHGRWDVLLGRDYRLWRVTRASNSQGRSPAQIPESSHQQQPAGITRRNGSSSRIGVAR